MKRNNKKYCIVCKKEIKEIGAYKKYCSEACKKKRKRSSFWIALLDQIANI